MYTSINELKAIVNRKIATNSYDSALFKIQSFVEQVMLNMETAGNIISSPELDELCQRIGSEIIKHNPVVQNPKQDDLIVYIATQLYNSGGHTAVIEDFIKYQPSKRHLILMTDIFDLSQRGVIEKRFEKFPVSFSWAPKRSLVKKILWLHENLLKLQPQKTFLFNHQQDTVAIAAVQPDLVPELYFFHHADYRLCLGVQLSHAIHIDAQSLGFHNCRHKLGIKNNIYWPLIAPDLSVRPKELPFMMQKKLVTCSSGSPLKFETSYIYPYAKIVPKILATTGGKHIHIGKLSKHTLQIIKNNMRQQGVALDNFVYIPWVKSVWQTVIDNKVDVYLNSFPISGGRACIEIMGSGTPLIMHENYRSEYLGQVYMAYAGAFYWKKPEELFKYLADLSPENLSYQSQLARDHYEKYHAPSLLEKELQYSAMDVKGLITSSIPPYQGDKLQVFLESNSELTVFNLLKKYFFSITFSNKYFTFLARRLRKYWQAAF